MISFVLHNINIVWFSTLHYIFTMYIDLFYASICICMYDVLGGIVSYCTMTNIYIYDAIHLAWLKVVKIEVFIPVYLHTYGLKNSTTSACCTSGDIFISNTNIPQLIFFIHYTPSFALWHMLKIDLSKKTLTSFVRCNINIPRFSTT